MSNPTGLYSIIKTWGTTDTILAADLNAEFNNVLNNFNPEMLAGYSQNQAQMQIQTYPGGLGSESLAVSISGELERIRYQLNAIQGTTYWYQSPATTLSQLNSLLGAAALSNRVNSGVTTGTTGSAQPCFLVPSNTTNTVTMAGATTSLNYTIAGANYVISSNVSVTGLTLSAGTASGNVALINDLTLAQAGTASQMLYGENGSQIVLTTTGSAISNNVGNICAFEVSASSEMFLARVEGATSGGAGTLTQVSRGYFFNSSSNLVSRGTLATGGTISLMNIAWIYATTSGTLVAGYNNPSVGGIAPTSPASGNYWYDTATNVWMIYTSGSWVAANATLVGMTVQNGTATIGARSFDFYAAYADTNTIELWADQINAATSVRARYPGGQVNVYGNVILSPASEMSWSFATNMDTGSQQASTMYYFYLDTNGRPWISMVAPYDRRADLRGYYHPGQPWRCLGYGWSNSATQVENVESFFRTDTTSPVSNITAGSNIILPYNIVQNENIITLNAQGGAITQVLPPPAQLKGKTITYTRTDTNIGNVITLQSWGTNSANRVGTISVTSNANVITGLDATTGMAPGQLISGYGIAPNTTLVSLVGTTAATISANVLLTIAGVTLSCANAAGYSGTVGQQTAYINYGIDGAFTTTLNTYGETVVITSDGFAYYIVNRYYPSYWTNAGTTTVTASTTNPTKGTNTTDYMQWKRVGSGIQVKSAYIQTGAGTSGTGDYVFGIPLSGVAIDTNACPAYTTIIGYNAVGKPTNFVGNGLLSSAGNNFIGPVHVLVYSTTQVRFYWDTGTDSGMFASSIGYTAGTLNFAVDYWVPILGWNS